MENELVRCVEQTLLQFHMLEEPVTRIVVGISGGADSVCLLTALRELSEKRNLSLRAVHVHHGLREAADQDEQYVKDLCKKFDIPLVCEHIDAAGYAKENHLGIEETGHILRRRCFEKACDLWDQEAGDGSTAKIALAHHMEDQAETVLFHMCRGSRLRGLRGMKAAEGKWIRPLLFVNRAQIEDFLQERELSWRTDESNTDTTYKRNLIRQEILPLMENKINERTTEHISQLAQEASDIEKYLEEQTRKALEECLVRETSYRNSNEKQVLSVLQMERYPELIQRRMIMEVLSQVCGKRKDLTAAHVRAVLDLLEKESEKTLQLPYGILCRKSYDRLIFTTADKVETSYPTEEKDYTIRIFPYDGNRDAIPRGAYTKWFDYDKIVTIPTFRVRQEGDQITLSSDGQTKKITRCMIDAKIPKYLRDQILLPAVENEILWIPGGRISARYEVTDTTKQILALSIMSREQAEEPSFR